MRRNRSSAYERPDVISAYVAHEVDLDRMTLLPPTPSLATPLLQLSPFGVIPKKHKPDKWQLIVVSRRAQRNQAGPVLGDLHVYPSLDHAVELAKSMGKGVLLAKLLAKLDLFQGNHVRLPACHPLGIQVSLPSLRSFLREVWGGYPMRILCVHRYVAFLANEESILSGIWWSQIYQALGSPFTRPMP